jgi:soluble lytic murein transglycosylase-like protein
MRKALTALLVAALTMPIATANAQSRDTYISDTAYEACVEYGEEYGICPELLMAIAERESGGNPTAESGGCSGLMQISAKWQKPRIESLGVEDIYDERSNILVATDYLSELFEEYGEVSLVLDKYNGNSKAEYNYNNGIISDYARKILIRSEELERLHGK